jgi:hypothetical protein
MATCCRQKTSLLQQSGIGWHRAGHRHRAHRQRGRGEREEEEEERGEKPGREGKANQKREEGEGQSNSLRGRREGCYTCMLSPFIPPPHTLSIPKAVLGIGGPENNCVRLRLRN